MRSMTNTKQETRIKPHQLIIKLLKSSSDEKNLKNSQEKKERHIRVKTKIPEGVTEQSKGEKPD